MVRYYKLFDLLNRKGMKKSDLRQILSSATVAKLSKGEYISGEAIEKICMFLGCQPGDIMEIVTMEETTDENIKHTTINTLVQCGFDEYETQERYMFEEQPHNLTVGESDAQNLTIRHEIH